MTVRAWQTYGKWMGGMDELVRPLVEGQVVWDLGAGTLGHTFRLLEMGAKHVIAVDKGGFDPSRYRGKAIAVVEDYFVNIVPPVGGIKVALLAWPTNHHLHGLERLLRVAETVIYLGSNTDGNSCGDSHLWAYLLTREVLGCVPHRRNSLIIYGAPLPQGVRRTPLAEEWGATCGRLVSYEEAEDMSMKMATIVATARRDP